MRKHKELLDNQNHMASQLEKPTIELHSVLDYHLDVILISDEVYSILKIDGQRKKEIDDIKRNVEHMMQKLRDQTSKKLKEAQ